MELKNKNGLTESEFLKQYDPERYKRPSVTADVAIFTRENTSVKLLLIKRGNHPFLGQYALPGGFVELFEDIEKAALRELYEETNIKGVTLTQIGAYGDANRDPRTHIVTILYAAALEKIEAKAGDDAAEARLFKLNVEKRPDGSFYIKLHSENTELSARLKRSDESGAHKTIVVENNGICSDHAALIFDAYMAMKPMLFN
ncbi:MAG: NUDIX hydrolase [Clostridia bacterium]|nr:NUDIX hydrolase [Clostridia bacterium]